MLERTNAPIGHFLDRQTPKKILTSQVQDKQTFEITKRMSSRRLQTSLWVLSARDDPMNLERLH